APSVPACSGRRQNAHQPESHSRTESRLPGTGLCRNSAGRSPDTSASFSPDSPSSPPATPASKTPPLHTEISILWQFPYPDHPYTAPTLSYLLLSSSVLSVP